MSSFKRHVPTLVFGTLAVGLVCSNLSRTPTNPSPATESSPLQTDAVVVGAGIAGLSAAWELAQGGAKVIVVDMGSVFGGHAVMATGDLCLIGTPDQAARGLQDSPEIALRDFVNWGENPNLDWVRYYVDHTGPEIYDWVSAMGVTFDAIVTAPGNSVSRMHRTRGRGLALVSPIYRACLQNPNITFIWNTRVDRLLAGERRIAGVAATNLRSGAPLELHAGAVVIATGGFQSNLEMVREFWPAGQPFPENILVGSGINSMGSGLKLAHDAGALLARLDHQWNYVTGLPDPRFPGTKRGLNARNYDAIWVNTDGKRFVPEHTLGHRKTLEILLRQKDTTYWCLFDESAKTNFWVAGADWTNFSVIEKRILRNPALVKTAASLEELAAKTGLPATTLAETVRCYNEMAENGTDTEFGRFGPGKSHQPKKMMTPPLYAVPFVPLTRKSMGGVVIDTACRVRSSAEETIPGLYAAGEVTGLAGINGKAGLEGTFLGPSIVTGRIAGRTVLADLGRLPSPARVVAQLPEPAIKPDPLATTPLCLTCHDLPKLLASPRPGYWHFEKVHHEVVATKRDCTQCHAELTPTFSPETHRINRRAQVQVCAACHQGEDR